MTTNHARQAFDFILEAMESNATDYGDAGTVADETMPNGAVRAHFTNDRFHNLWNLFNGSELDNIDYAVTDVSVGRATLTIYGFLPGFGDTVRPADPDAPLCLFHANRLAGHCNCPK